MRNKGKVDKSMEIKRSTMSVMRLLGKLLIAFAEDDSSLTYFCEETLPGWKVLLTK